VFVLIFVSSPHYFLKKPLGIKEKTLQKPPDVSKCRYEIPYSGKYYNNVILKKDADMAKKIVVKASGFSNSGDKNKLCCIKVHRNPVMSNT